MKRLDTQIEDYIDSLFEEYAKKNKRSKRAQLAWLIEEVLKKEGMLGERGGQEVTLKAQRPPQQSSREDNRL